MITIFGRQVALGTFIGFIISGAAVGGGQIMDWFNKYEPSQATLVGAILSAIGVVGFVWNNQTHVADTATPPVKPAV